MGKMIPGRDIAKNILWETKNKIETNNLKPTLDVILASNDSSTYTYVAMKKKKAERLGIEVRVKEFGETVSKDQLIQEIKQSNADGVLIQLPFFEHLQADTLEIVNSLDPSKDVDGLTAVQQGRVSQLLPNSFPTAAVEAVLESINFAMVGYDSSWDSISSKRNITALEGKNILVANNTILIGKPLALALSSLNATVTIANHTTKNLKELSKNADIIVSATNVTNLFNSEDIKEDAILIDVTSVSTDNGVLGDFVYSQELIDKCSFYTPVPGGIGPLTIACLLRNVVRSSNNQI